MSDDSVNDALLYQNMRAMISLIDRLRDFNLHDYIALPRITVLGEQSAGKSSLLESICGLNFLPRGSGVVTRRPLELRMVKSNISTPYFVFPKDFKDKKFINPDEVRACIEELTNKVAGGEKHISDDPIICTVYSPSVPDLTLVDLPGITRIAIGDQPKNIEEITKGLVKKYCDDPNSLILCVIPANIDLSTSDALNFAKQLDPTGSRTLGVITKIDLMDEGTDAVNVLLNKEIKLRYGYVAVKGRSQKEVKENLTVKEAIQRELDYFGKHPVYSTLPTELLGTRSLVDRTSQILYDMIKTALPRIKSEIIDRKRKAREGLEALGEEFPEAQEQKLELVFRLVRNFKECFDQEITGKYFHEKTTKRRDRDSQRKRQGETITFQLNRLFNELYEEYCDKNYKVSKNYTNEFIRHAIDVYQGESIPGFHSFDSFLYLVHPKLDMLKGPVHHLLDEAKNILEMKGLELLDFIFKKFGRLSAEVKETFQRVLNHFKNSTRKILENILACEENYIFTNDSLMFENPFVDPNKKFRNGQDLLTDELRIRIDNYFYIVVRNLKDEVPKIVGHFLLKKFNESLEVEILNALNKKGYCLEVFAENQLTTDTRSRLKRELQALSNAESLLVNEFNMGFNLKGDIESEKVLARSSERVPLTDFDQDYLEDIEALNDEFLRFNSFLLNNKTGMGNQLGLSGNSVPPQRQHPTQGYGSNVSRPGPSQPPVQGPGQSHGQGPTSGPSGPQPAQQPSSFRGPVNQQLQDDPRQAPQLNPNQKHSNVNINFNNQNNRSGPLMGPSQPFGQGMPIQNPQGQPINQRGQQQQSVGMQNQPQQQQNQQNQPSLQNPSNPVRTQPKDPFDFNFGGTTGGSNPTQQNGGFNPQGRNAPSLLGNPNNNRPLSPFVSQPTPAQNNPADSQQAQQQKKTNNLFGELSKKP